jgi:hypothetical protein
MNGIPLSAETIRKLNSVNELNNFISRLGYKAKPQPLHIPALDLPESTQKIIKELHIISDYDQKFQIYFGKTSSMRRTDFRTILEPFYRRYPQINSLFIFTENWDEIAFVSPERVATEPKKVKLLLRILLVDPQNVYHTDIEVLNSISILPVEQKPEIIWQKHSEAFNVERVTKEFFEAYKSALKFIKEDILVPQEKSSYQEVHSFAQQLLSRIMFLYYVQKKGWLKWKDYVQDKRYIKILWEKYKKTNPKKDTFYSLWLSSLFFHAFNKKHQYLTLNIPDEIKESFNLMPFLNGGLFTQNELDEIGFKVPDEVFKLLFETDPLDNKKGFLERYNFTIREDTPLEVEVAVDPEMLGKVYESLISEEERGKGGIFYTPRIEIDYMCRLSLVEYLSEETKLPKTDLIPLVFEPQRILDVGAIHELPINDLRKIKESIDRVRIVDPAVGSASFLVGMMNVLVEIQRYLSLKVDKREENLFALKNKVLSENLYGVDVKDWAVMVGELRLWLSLIIETEEKFMDIYTKPLLPNLTFKIRRGDSLVEEIAGIPIPLRGKFAFIPKGVKEKITMLVDRKVEYFRGGRSAALKEKDEIEGLENEILKEIESSEIRRLDEEENKLEKQISAPKPEQFEMFKIKPEQKDLFEEQIKKLKKQLEEIRPEKERLTNLLKEIGKKTKKDYFLWEVDFAEIFAEKGGFDIVIGNPPYVLYKRIGPPDVRRENCHEDTWKRERAKYIGKLKSSVKLQWSNSVEIEGSRASRSHLYIYFYYIGLSLLKANGVFCFINSDGWLNDDYGVPLQEFLLKRMEPLYIVDNQIKRSFKESIAHTVIVCIKKSGIEKNNLIKFVAFKKAFDEVLTPNNLIELERCTEIKSTEDFRVFPMTIKELLKDGIELPSEGTLLQDLEFLPYTGSKWGGKYLRAPMIFFKILKESKSILMPLKKIAFIRTGVKESGFKAYISSKDKVVSPQDIKKFIPILKNPEFHSRINITESDSFITKDINKFIKKCKKLKSEILWKNATGLTHKRHRNVNQLPYTGNYLGIEPFDKKQVNTLLGILNSTFVILLTELMGRSKATRSGSLTITKSDLEKLPILDSNTVKGIDKVVEKLEKRDFCTVFEELGLPMPNPDYSNIDPQDISFDKVMPDRRELDKIIFEALGLTEEGQLEVYRAVVELVKNRLVKARSV